MVSRRATSYQGVLRVLEATKVAQWRLPFDRIASRVRELLGEGRVDYVDLGKTHGFPVTLEVFALPEEELTLILFRRALGPTALAIGNITERNEGLAKKIERGVRERPLGPPLVH